MNSRMIDKNTLINILEKGVLTVEIYQQVMNYYLRLGYPDDWFGCIDNSGCQQDYLTPTDKYKYVLNYRGEGEKTYELLAIENLLQSSQLKILNSDTQGVKFMELRDIEKNYLKEFLLIVDKGGVRGLVTACENKEFAIVPFIEIIKRVVGIQELD
jgi:hypothetical protein